jgi:hypothetical protein
MKYINKNFFPRRHFTITPSDTVDIAEFGKTPENAGVVYCAADGTAQVVDMYGEVLEYVLVAGDIIPVLVRRINTTDTTGTYYGLVE